MNNDNLILNLPFDEGKDSPVAYDYSRSRADAEVFGAKFVPGRNGNAIEFKGQDWCETTANIVSSLANDFTILASVYGGRIDTGSPRQVIWLLNFEGDNNHVEVPMQITPGAWSNVALTRKGQIYTLYLNTTIAKAIQGEGRVLKGISLSQDYYGGEYGLGMLDDVKVFNVGLTRSEIIDEFVASKKQAYYLDGVNFKDYGVYVSDSQGVVSKPKLKAPASVSWDNYHGESVDLQHKFYEPREITLSCFIKANSKGDFIAKVSTFQHLFDKKGTNRLTIDVHPVKPLVYEVYCKDEIAVEKSWNDALMVGTFKLKLIEPEPVKRVLKHMRVDAATSTCTITISTKKMVNIFWGDGSADYDVSGEDVTVNHDFAANGDFFPVVTGCIDEITSFSTNAIVVWNRL